MYPEAGTVAEKLPSENFSLNLKVLSSGVHFTEQAFPSVTLPAEVIVDDPSVLAVVLEEYPQMPFSPRCAATWKV